MPKWVCVKVVNYKLCSNTGEALVLQDILECARPELFSLSKRGIGNSCMTIGNVTAKLHSLSGKLWSPIFSLKTPGEVFKVSPWVVGVAVYIE